VWLYWNRLGTVHNALADEKHAAGQFHEARRSQQLALEAYRRAQELNPTSWFNNAMLSSFLVEAIDEEFRRPQEAYLLAKSSNSRLSNQITLLAKATAECYSSRYAEAIDTLDEMARRYQPEDCDAKFVRAISLWRLGDQTNAERTYRAGVELIDDEPRPQLIRLRNEAAALLGIDPTTGEPINSEPINSD
jgi:Flp pilus assembly protein TadD